MKNEEKDLKNKKSLNDKKNKDKKEKKEKKKQKKKKVKKAEEALGFRSYESDNSKIENDKKQSDKEKEKIKKKEEAKKKMADKKESKEKLKYEDWYDCINESKETFFNTTLPFKPTIVSRESINLQNFSHNNAVSFHSVKYKNIHSKKCKEEWKVIKNKLIECIEKCAQECYNDKFLNNLNKIVYNNRKSLEDIRTDIIKNNIVINSQVEKAIENLSMPFDKTKFIPILSVNNNFKVENSFLSNSNRTEKSLEDFHTNVLSNSLPLGLAISDRVSNLINENSKYFKSTIKKTSNGFIIGLETMFNTYVGSKDTELKYSLGYLPTKNLFNLNTWDKCGEDYLSTVTDESQSMTEIDLAKPYMCLSAIYGLMFRSKREKRILENFSASPNFLFDLYLIPNKQPENQKKFSFVYNHKVSFEFIERIRNTIDSNIDQRDVLNTCYEFGRVLAYYTFLLSFNRSRCRELADLIEEVKTILFELADLVLKMQQKGLIDGLVGSGIDETKEMTVDRSDYGEWGIGVRLKPDFLVALEAIEAYVTGNANDTPDREIFNLAYVALQFILLGAVPTLISKTSNVTTLNMFIHSYKQGATKDFQGFIEFDKVNNGNNSYEDMALYGLIYSYYNLRNFYSKTNPYHSSDTFFEFSNIGNRGIFFDVLYDIGLNIERNSISKPETNKTYLVEIMENNLFSANMKLKDFLNLNRVFSPADDIVKENDVNIPFLIAYGLNELIEPNSIIADNPIRKFISSAIKDGESELFSPESIELYLLESIAVTDLNTISPYKIYKILMITSMAREIYDELNKTAEGVKNDYETALMNVIISGEALAMKFYDTWFRSECGGAFILEERDTSYPVLQWIKNKHLFLQSECAFMIQLYVNSVTWNWANLQNNEPVLIDCKQSLEILYNDSYMTDLVREKCVTKFGMVDWNIAEDVMAGVIKHKFTPLLSTLQPKSDELTFNLIKRCLAATHDLDDNEKRRVYKLLNDLVPLPNTSSLNEVVDSFYKELSYPTEVFKRILMNIKEVYNSDLSNVSKFYLTFCLIYSSILKNTINNELIKPNSTIISIKDKDDLVELAIQTSNSIESFIVNVLKFIKDEKEKEKRKRPFRK